MSRVIPLTTKPRLMRSGGFWCCVGLASGQGWLPWLRNTTRPFSVYGATPKAAYEAWKREAAR